MPRWCRIDAGAATSREGMELKDEDAESKFLLGTGFPSITSALRMRVVMSEYVIDT